MKPLRVGSKWESRQHLHQRKRLLARTAQRSCRPRLLGRAVLSRQPGRASLFLGSAASGQGGSSQPPLQTCLPHRQDFGLQNRTPLAEVGQTSRRTTTCLQAELDCLVRCLLQTFLGLGSIMGMLQSDRRQHSSTTHPSVFSSSCIQHHLGGQARHQFRERFRTWQFP